MKFNSIMPLVKRQTFRDSSDALCCFDTVETSVPYAVFRIAREARVSLAQAALIAQLLGISTETQQ
ncbi:hypothetical protein [Microvirga zambiensis]|uniref:hypothetical protein n=1 Tax=Microvirga zambiensis TaxID=1402137 RepID=UPI00192001A2|nr:hypothetical protein [Microvirga zambiensis]